MIGMPCIAYHGILKTAVKHTHKFMQGITIRKQTKQISAEGTSLFHNANIIPLF
jgi:hypothetical protein